MNADTKCRICGRDLTGQIRYQNARGQEHCEPCECETVAPKATARRKVTRGDVLARLAKEMRDALAGRDDVRRQMERALAELHQTQIALWGLKAMLAIGDLGFWGRVWWCVFAGRRQAVKR